MASTITRSVASGSTAVFSVPFPYLDKTHVQVRLNGVLKALGVDYTFPTSSTIQITAGNPTAGTIVERKRVTPTETLTEFQPGNLDSGDLNVGILQPLYLAQEGNDAAADILLRAWFTINFGNGGTITVGPDGTILIWDATGNVVPGPSASDIAGYSAAAAASAAAALASQNAASASATLAQKWASNPEDTPVVTGPSQFSALHWAAKALASAVSAAAVLAAAAFPSSPVANTFLQRNAGNTQYDAKTATEVRNALAAAAFVADRTAVKALDPTKDKAATTYGEGLGRNGTWVPFLTSGLSSADVAAKALDTVEAIYLTSGSYTWIRHGDWRANGARALWFGLDPAASDNATATQIGVNVTASLGVAFNMEPGVYKLGSAVTVPANSNIQGPGQPADRNGAFSTSACYFHFNHTGVGLNLLGTNDGARRLAGFGTYRTQPTPGPGWVPLAALADVQISGCYDAIVEDIFFYNPTTALRVTGNTASTGYGNGRLTLRRLRGQPLSAGLTMTHVYDCAYVDDIHWWVYWSADANVISYTKTNAFAFILGRVDWPQFGRIFSWGLGTGVHINQQASVGLDGGLPPGTTTAAHFDSVGADNCERGLVIASGANGATVSMDHIYATNTVYAASSMISMAADNCRVAILDAYVANTNASGLAITGGGNDVKIGAYRSSGIDHDANGTPEFDLATGVNKLTLMSKPITSAGGGVLYNPVGTSRISSPDWINFTPTITASTGTITTVAAITAGDCKYKLEGTTLSYDITVTITTNGTGAGTLLATMPYQAKKVSTSGVGRTGVVMLVGVSQSSVARLDMNKYDGTYPGADATTIRCVGSYEIA